MKWTRRLRERRPDSRPRERVSWLGLLLVLLVLAGIGFLYAYPRLREPPLVRRDFVGRVVDKSLTLGETQLGTRHYPRLLVRTEDGRQFEVAVTPEQYEGARAGMWVARTGGEIRLSWGEPGGGGTRVEAR